MAYLLNKMMLGDGEICTGGLQSLCLGAIDGNWFGVILEIILYIFCLVSLQTICRDFLVPSLEVLCVRCKLKEDVAGATFLAFGTAAAEIMISCITIVHGDVYIDVGIGSIVGASLMGTLLIPGICAVISEKPLEIRSAVFMRDTIFFLLSLMGLVIFIVDGTIYGLEAIYLLVIFVGYVVCICLSPLVKRSFRFNREAQDAMNSALMSADGMDDDMEYAPVNDAADVAVEEIAVESLNPIDNAQPVMAKASGVKTAVSSFYTRFVVNPSRFVFNHLIPKCTHGTQFEYLYPLTMIVSLLHLFIIAFVMSAVCQRWTTLMIGAGFISFRSLFSNIGVVVGLVLVSVNLSIPDLQYAMRMSSAGHGYVAINNSISAQILTISLGIGLPMLIKALITGSGVDISGYQLVGQCSILLSIAILLFIGMTLIPTIIKKEDKCTVDDIRGKILVVVTILLLIVCLVLSLRKASCVCYKSIGRFIHV